MPAFSTCWNNSRHHDGEAMVDEILGLGFTRLELSHGMTVAKLPGLRKAFADGRFTCVGVHNYFPSPVEVMIDAPDAYEFTSHRAPDRKRALDMTLKTLEIAAEFKARYLVLHMGSVPMKKRKWTRPLQDLAEAGQRDTEDFARKRIAFLRKREKIAPLYLRRAIETLEILAEKAEECGVNLAVESRSHFEDVPTEREMLEIQQRFKDHPRVRYWHDFGHVQRKHHLGLLDHGQWLETMQPYTLGAHVHDVHWPARDHRVPFTGDIDFKSWIPLLGPEPICTWELSPGRKAGEIRQALRVWKSLFPRL
jgi:sugar phosphate isomerase/epimerase